MVAVESTFVSSPDSKQETFEVVCVLPCVEERAAKATIPNFIFCSF